VIALVLMGCTIACAAPPNIQLLWATNLDTLLESAATVADINGDGRDEVVVAGQTSLVALNGFGAVLWKWETPGRFCTYPSVLPRGREPALLYAADYAGKMHCLDGKGNVVWEAALNGFTNWSASVVCELNGDGKPEVIQTDAQGTVWAFDAATGSVRWKAQVEGQPVSPAVADLDGDGLPEIVIATGSGLLFALKNDGSAIWRRALGSTSPSWQTSAPVVFSAADRSQRIAVGSSGGALFCLNASGEVLWQRAVKGPVASSISIADFDGDGLADIFLVTERGIIYRFREDGSPVWTVDMQGRTLAPGAILDINADGKLEYVLCTQNGRLLVLGQNADLLLDRKFDHRTINGTPAFGDIRPDLPGLEMAITGGESGRLLCFSTQASKEAPRPWPSYRHDAAMSGAASPLAGKAAAAMMPDNLGPGNVLCGQAVSFKVVNPDAGGKPLTATARCLLPDGSTQSVMVRVAQKECEVSLPVEPLVAGKYSFAWSLVSAEGREIASGARELFIEPFINDRAVVAQAVQALRTAANLARDTLPLSAAALTREARLLDEDAKALLPAQEAALSATAATASRAEALRRTGNLVSSAQRTLRVADIVRQAIALGPGTSVLAFEPDNPWESLRVAEELPKRAQMPLVIARKAVPGEREPVALNLFNITDRPVQVRVLVETRSGGPSVVMHRAMGVPTPMGEIAWDALPELDESSAVAIPSLSSAQLWLDIDLAAVRPGKHEIKVRLQAIDGAGVLEGPANRRAVPAPETAVTITLDVLPFEMASPGSFRLCTWGHVETSQYKDYPDATYETLLSHGNNVFPIGGLPAAGYDSTGTLTGSLDYSPLDALIQRFRGKDVVLLLNGYPRLAPKGGAGGFGSEPYKKALKQYLVDLVNHMQAMGFGRTQYALYPVDEPGGAGWPAVRRLVEFGKMVKAIDPAILIYADGGGDVAMYQALSPVIDIWCPGLGQAATEPEKMTIMRAPGKQVWSYDCGYSNSTASGRTLKGGDLVAQYRAAGLCAFRYDLTGAGFWTSIAGADDPWTRTEGYDYMILYPGWTRPVTSRRWEAVREGIEDFRILTALRARLASSGKDSQDRITHLLQIALPAFISDVMNYQEIPQHLDKELKALRDEMMECVAASVSGKQG
jgi:outer membrane protein assembly factor BamB